MGLLSVIGMVSTAVVVLALLLLLIRLAVIRLRNRSNPRASPKHGKNSRTVPIVYDGAYEKLRKAWMSRFYASYRQMAGQLEIPKDAFTVTKCTCVFSLEHVPVEHYAWVDNGVTYYFPKWVSIGGYLTDPTYVHIFSPEEEQSLFGWRIPSDYLESYEEDGKTGYVTALYKDSMGRRYRTVLLEGGAAFLRAFFPLKDITLLERQAYLGSINNIRDMKSLMRELEDKRCRGVLSDKEYEIEKLKIIKNL